jgi:hypothetical protein
MPVGARVSGRGRKRGFSSHGKDKRRVRRQSVDPHCQRAEAATLSFGSNDFDEQTGVCDVRYLNARKPTEPFVAIRLAQLLQNIGGNVSHQHIAPYDSTLLSVTWNLQETEANQNPLTRYIISVEHYTGCAIRPIVKFQVPVLEASDCTQVLKSQLTGTTQPFRVKVCAGDKIFVGISMILAEDCPVQCGVPIATAPTTNVTALSVALASVYLF